MSARITATIAVLALAAAACGGDSGSGSGEPSAPTGPTIPAEIDAVLDASAQAMGDVTSVRFELTRGGERVYIDQFQSISIDKVVGEFTVPQSAQAVLDVEVNDSLKTQLAAIALADEIWLSNPITGEFETLPSGYDIDPSAFFDPTNGWRPLMAGLTDTALVGVVDRGGTRYHVRGTATADLMRIITAGLVRNQDVVIDFWIDPVSTLVRSAEFDTDLSSTASSDATTSTDITSWKLELSRYGDEFTIVPPDELDS